MLLEDKNCHLHHCLAIPGLSVNQVISQDFPGHGNFPIKIPGVSRRQEWEPYVI